MALDYNNDACKIAAEMLETELGLLDYRLVEYLNELNTMVGILNGQVSSRQIVALAILTWKRSVVDDFTKTPHKS